MMKLLCLGSLLALLLCSGAHADVFKYRDNAGRTHFVDSKEKIPAEYRDQVEGTESLPPISRVKSGRTQLYEKSHYESPAAPASVELYVAEWCHFCKQLEDFLKKEHISYARYDIEKSRKGMATYRKLGGGGVPVTIVKAQPGAGEQIVRGYRPQEILALIRKKR